MKETGINSHPWSVTDVSVLKVTSRTAVHDRWKSTVEVGVDQVSERTFKSEKATELQGDQ